MNVPLFRPRKLSGKYLETVLASRHLTSGPMVGELREAIADWAGVDLPEVVLGNSARELFRALVRALWPCRFDFRPLETYPPMLWVAQGEAEVGSWYIVTVLTDIGGANCGGAYDGEGLVVRDACHSWVPGTAPYELFSFYPTKLAGAAEGGVLICRDRPRIGQRLQMLVDGGVPGSGSSPEYDRGYRSGRIARMTDVQAALALEAFEDLGSRQDEAAEAWWELRKLLGGTDFVDQPDQPYLFQVRVPTVPAYRERLADRGIGSGWNFPPAPLLTLPCWGLTSDERRRVARAFLEVDAEIQEVIHDES